MTFHIFRDYFSLLLRFKNVPRADSNISNDLSANFFRMAVTSTIIRLGYHSRIRGRSMQEI